MNDGQNIVEIRNLKKYFPVKHKLFAKQNCLVRAVDDISFTIKKGETLGLVGESGCGKSTTGRTIVRLYKPTAGSVLYDGIDLAKLSKKEMRIMRRNMQIIFQDPFSSLNPRMTVGNIISEPFVIHNMGTKKTCKEHVEALINKVGLKGDTYYRYPHEFSGGQCQRLVIARALALNPEFIVCDEPISALDVSIQAQIVNLLEGLQEELKLTYLFIAHDLSMVRYISNRVAVMYLGKIFELGESEEIYTHPLHPYTKGLLSSIPYPNPKVERTRTRHFPSGEIPSPTDPPSGCRYHPRCPIADKKCKSDQPELKSVGKQHWVACHLI